ncbi:DNA polymerase III subunit alpha, partial [bacterium]|nr:DNA polymerase III subunit alpha [bacterium]
LIINNALKELSQETGAPLIATADVHYIRSEDAKAHDVLLAVQTRNKISDRERLTMADDVSFKSQKAMVEFFKDIPEAIENTYQIAKEVNLEIDLSKKHLPKFNQEENFDSFSCLKTLTLSGLKKKYQKITPEIKKRFEYELSVIQKTGFADYFLIVQDFVSFAKRNGIIVGPGRGSAAGSIISYALDITTIDPLKYKLLFERFLNPERISLPDIDVDFDDQRRDEVINYVKKKYGEERVARIITFGTMAARPSIRDVGRALGIEYSFCDSLAKLVPFGYSLEKSQKEVPEFKNIYTKDQRAKQIIDIAKKLEGIVRHASVHACGVVIAPFDLVKKVPLQRSPQDPQTVITQYEMHSIENLGLLKMDFLGLKNLTLINEAIKGIKENEGREIEIEDIPLNDKRTFELLQKGETIGVFQLECLTGDTIVSNTTIKKLYERKNQKKRLVSVYLNEGKAHLNQVLDVLATGKRDVYILIAENNWYIKSTKDHYFLTENGWKRLEEIKLGDKVLIRSKAKHLIYNTCKMCGRQISGQKEGKSNFCYRCSAKLYKNPSKRESREKIRAAKIRFYQNGGRPWNYGVTVENNEIWKKAAQKISKALRGRTFEEIYGPEKANEMKKKLSLRSRGSNNPMFGKKPPHRKGGYRKDLGHYVRSSWEADFARILKLYNLDYEYEPRTFKLIRANGEILHYTPDFYVPSQNTFYEIKGFLHDLDREKLELFKQQYPQINLVVISSTKFAELALKYKTLINWECPQIPKGFKFVKVKEIKYAGQEMTYDIMMCFPGNNFQANGFIVHNSGGMRRYLKKLKPTKFEDIISMVALYRPGPMELIPEFIARK